MADLSGWLEDLADKEEGDQFEVVRYPAIAIENEMFRPKGEALHPARYDKVALERIKQAVGPRVWDALYQQNPSGDEGGYFDNGMVRFYEEEDLPEDMVYYTAWDFAIGKKERNDYTVGVTVGVDSEENLWVVSMTRGRMDTFEIADAIIDNWEIFDEKLIGMEKGHIQMALGPYLEQRIRERNAYGLTTHELMPGRRDKELRARAIQGRMQQGKVFFPGWASWWDLMFSELMSFPFGTHDDIVDALAWLGLMLQEMDTPYTAPEPKKKSWKDRLHKFVIANTTSRKRSFLSA